MKSKKLDYLLLTIVIALTGFEVIYRASLLLQFIILIFVAVCFFYKKHTFKLKFWFWISPFLIPFIFQGLFIDNLSLGVNNILALVVKFVICYMVFEIIKERFHSTFVNLIYFFSVISLLLFPTQFSQSLTKSIKSTADSFIKPIGTEDLPPGFVSSTLILFTYQHIYGQDYVDLRNCGPFWEPGMFALFLILALLINIFVMKANLFSKKNVVFIIATITTFSTTGIICLFLILFFRFFISLNKTKQVFYFPILIVFIFMSYNYIWKFDFISGKIENNIAISSDDKRSRFGAVIYHFTELGKSPFIGASLKIGAEETSFAHEDKLSSPNGLSLVFFNWGIIVGTLYFVLLYIGIRNMLLLSRVLDYKIHFVFFLIFCILAFSQDITLRYFYIMILFFSFSYQRQKTINRPINWLK